MLGPRVGFAYSVASNTVLRGGYGIFNFHDAQQAGALANPPVVLSSTINNVLLGEIDSRPPELSKTGLFVLAKDDNRIPRTHNWNFTISQRLPRQMLLETSYVGSFSENLLNDGAGEINAVPEGATLGISSPNFDDFRPLSNYGGITERTHTFDQNYNSLQVLLARQTGRFTYSAAYTFSKNLGYRGGAQGASGNQLDLRNRIYGALAYDRTHVLNLAYSWEIPDVIKENHLGKALINGWQFSGITIFQSGVDLGANRGNFGINGTGAGGYSLDQDHIVGTNATTVQPILLCDPSQGLGQNQFISSSCFGAPSPGRNGTFIFPYLRGPVFQNHDLSVFKNFQMPYKESHKLQLRFSGYNFLNHPLNTFTGTGDPRLQLNFTNGALTNADTFGVTNTKFGKRILQIAIKYSF